MSTLRDMLYKEEYDKIWKAYLGFLDLSVDEFMDIQERLLFEQIDLLKQSSLGQKFLKNKDIKSIEDFKKVVPLTTYEDYADVLLNKRSEDLPSEPLHWVQTTWKGGTKPIKLAPYSETMVLEHTKMFLSSLILSTSKGRDHFSLRNHDKFLYGMAPLPYLTGFAPYILKNEIDFDYLPSTKEAEQLGFKERNMRGFELAMKHGADLFFGLSSVLVKIGEAYETGSKSKKLVMPANFKQAVKLIKAIYKKKIKKQALLPKDLFEFKGIVCGGTDSDTYKEQIKHYFGITPLEIFGGTESAAVATETWSRNGLTFFPDVNFLEFIPERELEKERLDPTYKVDTVLFNEIKEGKVYELVITKLRGGAFVRYRIGDMMQCISMRNEEDDIDLPQVKYLDRVSNIIDLSGFTRLTKQVINDAFKLNRYQDVKWVALKEQGDQKPFIHLYIEELDGVSKDLLRERLNEKLKKIDQDYHDIHEMLGYDPLKITYISKGMFSKYKETYQTELSVMNPSKDEFTNFMNLR
jgi:hypothetical protein